MKKLVVTILGISVLGIFGTTTASGAPAATRPPEAPNPTLAAETVDEISVPLDVLLYAQTEYQGYAVTHADKTTRDGKQVYRLRVDRSDAANYGDSFYLLYDMNWKLMGEEKVFQPVAQPEVKKAEVQQKPVDKPKEEQKKPDTSTTETTPTQPSVTPDSTTQSTQTQSTTTDTTQPTTNTTTTTDTQTTTTTTTSDGSTTEN